MTLPAPVAAEIRAAFAGRETPAEIAKRLGITECEVFAAIKSERCKPAARTTGTVNWQETRYKRDKRPSLDVCPEHCALPRPYKVAPGVFVCQACWEWEHSDAPIMSAEMKP